MADKQNNTNIAYQIISKLNAMDMQRGITNYKDVELTINEIVDQVFFKQNKYQNLEGIIKTLEMTAERLDQQSKNNPANKQLKSEVKRNKEIRDSLSVIKNNIVNNLNIKENATQEQLVLAEAILSEFGKTMNFATENKFNADNIGRQLMRESSGTVSDLKGRVKKFILKNKELYGDTEDAVKNVIKDIMKEVSGINASDVDVNLETGLAEINNILFKKAIHKNAFNIANTNKRATPAATRDHNIKQIKELGRDQAKVILDNIIDKTKNQYIGGQDPVESFYNGIAEGYKKALDGSYIQNRTKGMRGNSVNLQKNGEGYRIKDSLKRISKVLEDYGYSMHIRLNEKTGQMTIGYNKSSNQKIYDKNGNVDFSRLEGSFDIGLDDGSGLIRKKSGQKAVNMLSAEYRKSKGKEITFLSSVSDLAAEDVARIFENDFDLLRDEKIEELTRKINAQIRSRENLTATPNPYKTSGVHADTKSINSGVSSPGLLAVRTHSFSAANLFHKLIKDYNIKKPNIDAGEQNIRAVMSDLDLLMRMYGSGSTQEEINDYIYANEQLKYLTKHRASGLILDKIKPFANLGVNSSAIKQGATSDAIMGTLGAEVWDPILALGKESYRGYSQTDMALSRWKNKNRSIPKNWSAPVVRSKLGEELGVYNDRNTDNLQDIAYVTEEQVKAAYEKLYNEKVVNNKSMSAEEFYAKYGQAPSVTYDSILYNEDTAHNLDGYSDMGIKSITRKYVEKAWDTVEQDKSKDEAEKISLVRGKIRSKLGLRKDKKNGLSYTIRRDVNSENNRELQYHIYRRQAMTSGVKVGIGDGTRATAELVSNELMQEILRQAGYIDNEGNAKNIDAVKVAEAPSGRNLAGFVSSRMNYVLKTIRDKDGGIFKDESQKAIRNMLKVAGLNADFKDDTRLSIEDPLDKWRGMNDDDRAQMFMRLLLGTEGIADKFFQGRAYESDGNGGLKLINPKNLITSSSINQLDIMHWEKAVGNLDDDELGASKHTVGDRERQAVARSIKLAANGEDFSALNDYLQKAMANSDADNDLYKSRLLDHGTAISMTSHSLENNNGHDDRYTVKIGKGEGIFDISRLLNQVSFTDGAITELDKEQDFFRQIERLRIERAKQLAKEDNTTEEEALKKVRAKLMFGTDSNGNAIISGFSNIFEGGATNTVLADGLFLPNRGLDEIGEGRFARPGYAKEVIGLARTIENGKKYKEGASPWLDENFQSAVAAIVNDVDNKNGQTYKTTHKKKMDRSLVGQQNSVNALEALEGLKLEGLEDGEVVSKVLKDIANTAVQFSRGNVAEMLSYKGEKDILDHTKITSAEDQSKYDAYLHRLKMVYDDIYGTDKYVGKTLDMSNAEDLRNAIMDSITIGNKNFKLDEQGRAKGLAAIMHRFPSINGLDEKFVRAVINPLLQDGTMIAGLGLGRSMNADSDGDKLYAFLSQFYGGDMNEEEFKDIMTQMRVVQERDRRTSSLVGVYEGESAISKQGNMDISKDIIRGASDREGGIIGGILSKTNFLKTGVFSNLASGMRGLLSKSNLDELAVSEDYNSQEQAAKAIITRALFESMEQDAISSKKVEQRILQKKGINSNSTDQERKTAAALALTELETILNKFYDKDSGYADDPNNLIKDLTEIGIIDTTDGLSGRVVAQAIGNISQMSHGKEIAEKLGIKYASFDKDGNLELGKDNITDYGKISTSVLSDSLRWANNAAAEYGHKGLERMTWHDNTPGSRDANKNTAYNASKTFKDVIPEGTLTDLDNLDTKYVNIAESVAKVNGELSILKENLKGDLALEQSKIGVAEKESKARDKVTVSTEKQAEAIKSLKSTEESTDNVVFGRVKDYNGENIAVRNAIKSVLEPSGTYDTNLIQLMTTLEQARNAEDIDWVNLSDEERINKLINAEGPDAIKYFNQFKNLEQATSVGDIAHATSEALSRANAEDGVNVSSIAEIESFIKNLEVANPGSELAEKLTNILEDRNKIIDRFEQNSTILGRGDDEVSAIVDIATQRGQNAFGALTSYIDTMTGGKFKTLTPEANMSITSNGRTLRGKTDSIFMSTDKGDMNDVYIGDYKHTKDINAEAILQQLTYTHIIEQARKNGDSVDNVMGQIKQAGIGVEDVNLKKEEVEALLHSKGKIHNVLATTDDYGGTTIKTIDNTNSFVKELVQKVIEGKTITAEEQETLKNIVQTSPIASSKDEGLAAKQQTLKETQTGSEFYAKMLKDQESLSDLYQEKLKLEKEKLDYLNKGIVSSKEIKDIEEKIKQKDEEILKKKQEYEASGGDSNKTADTKRKFRDFADEKEKNFKADLVKANWDNIFKKPVARTEAQKAINADIVRKKKEFTLQEQIANTQKAIAEMGVNDPKALLAKESIASMQQQLAILQSQKFEIDEKNRLIIIGEGESQKVLGASEEELKNYKAQIDVLKKKHNLNISNIQTPKAKSGFLEEIFGNFKRQLTYMSTQSLVYKLIGYITQTFQQLINTIKQLDKAMIDLQIASGYTRDQMSDALKGYNEIASEMGRTTTDVLAAANDWLRAGYDIETANKLIRESMKLSTLGMMESADATKALISASKGWKLTAEEVSQVTDELTALDMAAATSAGDLATAMAKANATAALAGADRQSYEAYLTTVLDVSQQSPETAGTAFKTLFARYSNVKAGKFVSEYGLEDDTGEFEALNDVEAVLGKAGINIRNSVLEFRDITDVFEEIASKWGSMDGVTRNAVANALGGTRQREQVTILFENWDQTQKYKKIAEQSSGTANEKMLNYTTGIEAAQNRLTAAVEKFVSGQKYENLLTGIYDILTQIIKSVDKIVVAVAGFLLIKNISNGNLIKGISGIGNTMNSFVSSPVRDFNSWRFNRRENHNRWKEEYGSVTYGKFVEKYNENRSRELNDLDKTMSQTVERMKSNRATLNSGTKITDDNYINARALLASGNLDYRAMGKLGVKNDKLFDSAANLMDETFNDIDENFFSNNPMIENAKKKVESAFQMAVPGISENNDDLAYANAELAAARAQVAQKEKQVLAALGLTEDATEEEKNARLQAALAIRNEAKDKDLSADDVRTAGKMADDGNVKYGFGSISDKLDDSIYKDFFTLTNKTGLGKRTVRKAVDNAANFMDQIKSDEVSQNLLSKINFDEVEKARKSVGFMLDREKLLQEQKNQALQTVVQQLKDQGIDINSMSEQEKAAYLKKIDAILNNANAENKVAQEALKNGMTSERVRKTGNTNIGFSSFVKQNSSVISGFGNIAGMVGSAVGMSHMAGTGMSEDAQSWTSLGLSMAPMMGAAIGSIIPGIGTAVGAAIGGVVSLVGGIATWIADEKITTDEEILEQTKEANDQLSEIQKGLEEDEQTLNNLESNETTFGNLLKGVNQATGENISLSDAEWQQYQTILSDVINAHDGLYAAYDSEGNLIAKNAGEMANLNDIMGQSIEMMKEKVRQEKYNIANQTKDNDGKTFNLATTMHGAINNAYDESGTGISAAKSRIDSLSTFGKVKTTRNWGDAQDLMSKLAFLELSLPTDWMNTFTAEQKATIGTLRWIDNDTLVSRGSQNNPTVDDLLWLSQYVVGGRDINDEQIYTDNFTDKYRGALLKWKDDLNAAQSELKTLQAQQDQATRKAFTTQLGSAMSYVLQGQEEFTDLSGDSQSFLLNEVFGNIQVNPYKDGDKNKDVADTKDINDIYKKYKVIAEKAVDWGVNTNAAGMQFLSDYDNSQATAADDKKRQGLLIQMLNESGADAGSIKDILKGMNYEGFDNLIDKDGNWISDVLTDGKLDIDKLQEKITSKRERSVEAIQKNHLFSSDIKVKDPTTGEESNLLDNLTNEEVAALYGNLSNKTIKGIMDDDDGESLTAEEKLVKLRAELKKLSMGDFATATEYLSIFSQQMNINLSDTEALKKALNASNSGIWGWTHLNSIAKNFGLTIDQLIDNISFLGDIDIFGRTSKTLPQITEQFELIDNVVTDIRDNGLITAANLDALLQQFPELIRYVGQTFNGKTLQDVLEDAGKLKMRKYMASLENTLATSDVMFKDWADKFIAGENNKDIKDAISMFGNLESMQTVMRKVYETDEKGNFIYDENGKVVLRDGIESMALTATAAGGYINDSWAKLIAENVFNITTVGEEVEVVNQKLYEAMKNKMQGINPNMKIKAYGSGGLEQLLSTFSLNLIGNAEYMAASEMAMNAQAEINAARQVLAMEDEMRAEAVSKYISDLNDAYDRGTISLETYEKSLQGITKAAGASSEQLKELKEKLEDLKFDQLSQQFGKGAMSSEGYRGELLTLIAQNTIGSEDWLKFVDAYAGTYQQTFDILEKQEKTLSVDDYEGRNNIAKLKQQALLEQRAAYMAAGYAQYGDQYNPNEDPKVLELDIKRKDEYNKLYQEYKSYYDNGYIGLDDYIDSLTNLINSTDASAESIQQWSEDLEDSKVELTKLNFTKDTAKGDEYRQALANKMHRNDGTSQDYLTSKQGYFDSYDEEMSAEQSRRSLLGEHDYDGQIQSLENERQISAEKLAALTADKQENSKAYTSELKRQVDLQKQQLDLEKQKYEYQKKNAEEVLDAYSNILSYGINELQSRQQDINNMYDDEISKLQDINDQKKRSIELTKLQQELENAKKERVRTYTAGIGWTYQENKAKVKEAKQNLENYLDERKIQDLQYAQTQSNKLIQDQIDRLQDIQNYINDIKLLSSTTASLMDLKKNGIVPQDMTIDQAINQITNEAVNGENSKVVKLGTDFENYHTQFTEYSEKLATFEDDYPNKIKDLAGWAKTYKSDEDLVEQIKQDFAANIEPLIDSIPDIKDRLSSFLGDKDYETWTKELAEKFANALLEEEQVDGIEQVDLSDIYEALTAAESKLATANTLLSQIISNAFNVNIVDGSAGKEMTYDGRYRSSKIKTIDGVTYFTNDALDGWYSTSDSKVTKNANGYTVGEGAIRYKLSGYSSGIENGPVTYTGLAMLHGSPSSPEYVLNSDQAGTLLKNLATMTMSPYQAPIVDSYGNQTKSITYQFNGDMNLPNVQRPDQFFDELLKQANVQFPTLRRDYR